MKTSHCFLFFKGSTLLTIKAEDLDSSSNGKVTFRWGGEGSPDVRDPFILDQQSGQVVLSRAIDSPDHVSRLLILTFLTLAMGPLCITLSLFCTQIVPLQNRLSYQDLRSIFSEKRMDWVTSNLAQDICSSNIDVQSKTYWSPSHRHY